MAPSGDLVNKEFEVVARNEPARAAAQTGGPVVDDLLAVTAGDDAGAVWIGAARNYGPLRIYGGHFLGQALAAAFQTVPIAKLAHSLHAYFLRPGIPDQPIEYQVERLRDGGGYVTRAVRAIQQGQSTFYLTASFKDPESGDVHQPVAPTVATAAQATARRETAGQVRLPLPFTIGTGVELELLDDWSPLNTRRDANGIRLWMRVPVGAPEDARLQQCALAFLSDSTLLFNALRRHGQPFTTHRTTSLDHALWFHRVPRCGDWLLFDQSGPAAADGRGINQGFVYDATGGLLATVVQEGMMRRAPAPA